MSAVDAARPHILPFVFAIVFGVLLTVGAGMALIALGVLAV